MRTAKSLSVMAFAVLAFSTVALAQDWPQWRGPNRDNKVTGFAAPKVWPKALNKKWSIPVGIGEASPLLVGDKLYTFGRQGGDEVTMCFDAATGKEIWKDKVATAPATGAASGFPGPRSTPVVGEGKICTLGVQGIVTCLDAATGKVVWRKENKPKQPTYYTSTSPLIADGMCIVFVGSLTAYDLATGDARWKWSGASAPYGSPVLMAVDDVKTVVTPAVGTLASVGLADGKLLWDVKVGSGFDYTSNFSTPLIDGRTVIFSAAAKSGKGGKGGGSSSTIALKIEKKDGGLKATELWKKSMAADKYHAPTLRDGLIFGVSTPRRNFFCMDAKTGDERWQDQTPRGSCGCILDAGSVLLALTSDKELIAMKPSAKAYEEVAKYKVSDSETWCVPIVAGKRIYVKDKAGSLTLWTLD